ncbi:MAG: exodeoxyribonuclease V subunit alpha [Fibrobacterota bacterium]
MIHRAAYSFAVSMPGAEKAHRALAYALAKAVFEGHVSLNIREYPDSCNPCAFPDAEESLCAENPWIETEDDTNTLKALCTSSEDDPFIARISSDVQEHDIPPVPFIIQNNRAYLHRYFVYETRILENITRLAAEPAPREFSSDFFKLAHGLFHSREDVSTLTEDERIDWQCAAAIGGLLHNFLLITGGPGTGKTTTVGKLLALYFYENPSAEVVAAAPTGKAVQRLGQSLENSLSSPHFACEDEVIRHRLRDIPRATLHRLLGWQKNSTEFRHRAENPLTHDLIIVDEASMVDVPLMAKLMAAVKPGGTLILMGDRDQLASVEVGSIFGDLCRSFSGGGYTPQERELINACISRKECRIPSGFLSNNSHPALLVELRRSRRFSSTSAIGRLSAAVINGRVSEFFSIIKNEARRKEREVENISVYAGAGTLHTDFIRRIDTYAAYITEKDISSALKKLDRFRILCATRGGDHGVEKLNILVEQELSRRQLIYPGSAPLYHNKPLIIRENNYDLGLFNGDTGLVRESGAGLFFHYPAREKSDGETAKIPVEKLPRHEPLFAMTIHTSQGSEFDRVCIVLPDTKIPLLTRELLYTGITRAKQRVDIHGSREILSYTLRREVERVSGVEERIGSWV